MREVNNFCLRSNNTQILSRGSANCVQHFTIIRVRVQPEFSILKCYFWILPLVQFAQVALQFLELPMDPVENYIITATYIKCWMIKFPDAARWNLHRLQALHHFLVTHYFHHHPEQEGKRYSSWSNAKW